MPRQYERVNNHDEEDVRMTTHDPTPQPAVPHSPPPSFHSHASSTMRLSNVNPDLAEAFDPQDLSEDEDNEDDRQRLVRQSTVPPNALTSSDSSQRDNERTVSPSNRTTVPSTPLPRQMGGGIGTDGVFANLSAKPERTDPEKDEQPPTYEQAAADAAPPYWETTILAPGFSGLDEVYVDGMPVGSVFSFLWNGMISTSFQLVGFLLTYLLHSTHAAKNGSRAGLGITLVQYGFYMKSSSSTEPPAVIGSDDGYATPPDPNAHDFAAGDIVQGGPGGIGPPITGSDWLAYMLMVIGWFILIKSFADFLKARRHEQLVMQSPDRGLNMPVIAEGESVERVV